MTARDAIEVLDWLEQAGVPVCLDGGWGVDVLIGEETRSHEDLDLALDSERLIRAREALEKRGFRHDLGAEPGLPRAK